MANMINLPSFEKDPYYKKTQDLLFGTGSDILGGNLNDYYKGIGESGSKEFQGVLDMVQRDTSQAVLEDSVRRGATRGGSSKSVVSKAVADATAKLSYDDYARALAGKQFLLGTGLNTISDVGGKALTNQSQINQFAINRASLDLSGKKFTSTLEYQKEADKAAMWSSIISSGISAVGAIAGTMIAPGVGTVVGASLGKAAGGGASALMS